MRPDIAKKLVERPRYGGGGKENLISERRKGKNPNEWDNLPTKESCKLVNIRHYQGKYQSEYFQPLKGFLRKNVGRPWDKVNAEIRENLSASSTIHKHVLDHLYRDFVELTPIWVGKVPHSSRYGSKGRPYELRTGNFYVDLHGLLKAVKKGKPRPAYKPEVRKIINDLEEYRRIGDDWYWVRYRHVRAGDSGYDVVLRKEFQVSSWGNYELTRSNGEAIRMGLGMYSTVVRLAVEKRQVPKRTIKLEGLNNL